MSLETRWLMMGRFWDSSLKHVRSVVSDLLISTASLNSSP